MYKIYAIVILILFDIPLFFCQFSTPILSRCGTKISEVAYIKADVYSFFRSLGATNRTSCECPVRSKLVEQPGLVEFVNVGWVVIGENLLTTGGNLGYVSAVAFSEESTTGDAASRFKI